METSFIIIQAIGFLAFLISILSYQYKKQEQMFLLRVIADGTWALHYFLLVAMVPALTVLIATLRTYIVVFKYPQYKSYIILTAISLVCGVCTVLGENDLKSYIPALTALVYGASTYYHDSYFKSRLFMAIGLILWTTIGFMFNSYAEIISSSISLLSLMVGVYRHHFRRKAIQPAE